VPPQYISIDPAKNERGHHSGRSPSGRHWLSVSRRIQVIPGANGLLQLGLKFQQVVNISPTAAAVFAESKLRLSDTDKWSSSRRWLAAGGVTPGMSSA